MRRPYQWDEVNDLAKAKFGFEGTVRVFQSMSQAVFEIAMAAQNLYAHKRQFFHSLGYGTHADEGLLFLARQGTKGVEFTVDAVPPLDDKKTLFWLCDVDDAVTGEILHDPSTSSLEAKVFRIWIHHRHHFYKPPPQAIGDNDVFVFAGEDGLVVAHFGKRAASLQMVLAPTLKWESGPPLKNFPVRQEHKMWVQKIESEKWAGSESFFTAPVSRLFDRAILVWKDLDAGALRELLISKQKLAANHVEAVSLSRWNETRLLAQFEKRQVPGNVFRGTLLLSSELASEASLQIQVESAVQTLRQMSSF